MSGCLPAELIAGSEQREGAKKEIMSAFEGTLKQFLGAGDKDLNQITTHMNAQAGFKEAMSKARLRSVKAFANLFGSVTIDGRRARLTDSPRPQYRRLRAIRESPPEFRRLRRMVDTSLY